MGGFGTGFGMGEEFGSVMYMGVEIGDGVGGTDWGIFLGVGGGGGGGSGAKLETEVGNEPWTDAVTGDGIF